jgi:hypothetical protein
MRIPKNSASSHPVPVFDLLKLWGGLALLLLAIALFVDRMNKCVANDVQAHPFYATAPGMDSDSVHPGCS